MLEELLLSVWLLGVVFRVSNPTGARILGGVKISDRSQFSSFHHQIGHSDLIEQVRHRVGAYPADLFRKMVKQLRVSVTSGPESELGSVNAPSWR